MERVHRAERILLWRLMIRDDCFHFIRRLSMI